MKKLSICILMIFLSACASSQLPAPYENRSVISDPPPLASASHSSNSSNYPNTVSSKSTTNTGRYNQNRYETSSVATTYPIAQNDNRANNTGQNDTYVVQPGDTIASIARQKGLTIRTLLNLNNIDDPSLISSGQKLLIKPTGILNNNPTNSQISTNEEIYKTTPTITLITLPKVNKEAYSEDVYKRLLRGESINVPALSHVKDEVKKIEAKPVLPADKNAAVIAANLPASNTNEDGSKVSEPAKSPENNKAVLSASEQTKMQWPNQGAHSSANNRGINIRANKGSAVIAAEDGVVTLAGSGLSGYGQMIIIKHANNLISLYGNVGKLNIKEGAKVSKGQKIAEISNEETPLIFEVREKGRSISPLPLLRARK